MRLPRDPGFTTERSAFALRHTCEDCGFFDAATQSCAHEWPTDPHRRAYYEALPDGATDPRDLYEPGEPGEPRDSGATRDIVLCKEFELR